jgi:hypothetical protein
MATLLLLPPAKIFPSNEESDSNLIHSNVIASKGISFGKITDPFILEIAAQQLSGFKSRIALTQVVCGHRCGGFCGVHT